MTANETSTATASREESLRLALGRAVAYAHLALGFSYPEASTMDVFGQADKLPAGPIGDALCALRDAATDLDELQASYMRVFDPRQNPIELEAEHRTNHFQQRSELLVDVTGFYRAFGVAPDRERPDHIACELGFLHLLAEKEARAIRAGEDEAAGICAEAREKFLTDHVLAWYGALVAGVRVRADQGRDRFYRALADAFEAVMQAEEELNR